MLALLGWCYFLIMENKPISILGHTWTHPCVPIEPYYRYSLGKGNFRKVILATQFLKLIHAQQLIKLAQVFWSVNWPHNRAEPMPVPVTVMADSVFHIKLFCPSDSVFEFSKMQPMRVTFYIGAPEGSQPVDHSMPWAQVGLCERGDWWAHSVSRCTTRRGPLSQSRHIDELF